MKLYNSLTRRLQEFVPLQKNHVYLYVCGITPYDTTHLGHAFTYVWFDVLVRYLTFKGYKVTYTQNVTDINDRDNDILKKAKEQNVSWQKLGDYWTRKFLLDMKTLNWTMPDNYLKASEHIKPMINLIQKLIANGFAYEKSGSVYFDISKKKDFGKLSKLTKEQMLKIAKEFEEDIENPDKKNPLDFTLWRAFSVNQPAHIPSFESPFGMGRPGWHIECSAMSTSTLQDQIDIHGGGIDLMYPHHEAEIAQSEGATLKIPFSRLWMHVALVSYRGEKMAKSLGNLVMISDLLKKFSANAIRWVLLSHHYRTPWDFDEKEIREAEKKLSVITSVIRNEAPRSKLRGISRAEFLRSQPHFAKASLGVPLAPSSSKQALRFSAKGNKKPGAVNSESTYKAFVSLMDDDLNVPSVLNFILSLTGKNVSAQILKELLSLLGFRL